MGGFVLFYMDFSPFIRFQGLRVELRAQAPKVVGDKGCETRSCFSAVYFNGLNREDRVIFCRFGNEETYVSYCVIYSNGCRCRLQLWIGRVLTRTGRRLQDDLSTGTAVSVETIFRGLQTIIRPSSYGKIARGCSAFFSFYEDTRYDIILLRLFWIDPVLYNGITARGRRTSGWGVGDFRSFYHFRHYFCFFVLVAHVPIRLLLQSDEQLDTDFSAGAFPFRRRT